jgi:hypothetical protein
MINSLIRQDKISWENRRRHSPGFHSIRDGQKLEFLPIDNPAEDEEIQANDKEDVDKELVIDFQAVVLAQTFGILPGIESSPNEYAKTRRKGQSEKNDKRLIRPHDAQLEQEKGEDEQGRKEEDSLSQSSVIDLAHPSQ